MSNEEDDECVQAGGLGMTVEEARAAYPEYVDHSVTERGNRTEAYQARIEAALARLANGSETLSHEDILNLRARSEAMKRDAFGKPLPAPPPPRRCAAELRDEGRGAGWR